MSSMFQSVGALQMPTAKLRSRSFPSGECVTSGHSSVLSYMLLTTAGSYVHSVHHSMKECHSLKAVASTLQYYR
eukprot:6243-Heterococcus_DN1.PRE.5